MDGFKKVVGDIAVTLFTQWQRLPQSVRFLIRDALEAAAAAVSGVTLFWPQNAQDARQIGITVTVAIAAAVIAVIRRRVWQLILDRIDGEPGEG